MWASTASLILRTVDHMVARRRATYLCKRACQVAVARLPHVLQTVTFRVNGPQKVCCVVLQTGAKKE